SYKPVLTNCLKTPYKKIGLYEPQKMWFVHEVFAVCTLAKALNSLATSTPALVGVLPQRSLFEVIFMSAFLAPRICSAACQLLQQYLFQLCTPKRPIPIEGRSHTLGRLALSSSWIWVQRCCKLKK